MGRIFDRAAQRDASASDLAPGDYQAILRELGEEALAENAGWLLTHRSRPIEVVKG